MSLEAVIGLEVHVQLSTKSKIFCSCSTEFGSPPNKNICPVCSGLPGVLPVLNRRAVEYAVKTAIALNCSINRHSIFSRKNYFYPDLPKNYQISQYEFPIAERGYIDIYPEQKRKRIGIIRAHLEEDAGKLLHQLGSQDVSGSLVDFNRCGIPLLEIVSEPEISSPSEAYEYLTSIKAVLQYIGVSDCNMEEGSLRCDANVSVREPGGPLGTKAELKNMNSFKGVRAAIEFEINRQTDILHEGGRVIQETRLWDEKGMRTYAMRQKEEAHDYRYFPEPDLVPLKIEDEFIEEVKKGMPELPADRKARFIKEYGLSEYDSSVLISEKILADFFEDSIGDLKNDKSAVKMIVNWITAELLGKLNARNIGIKDCPVKPSGVNSLIKAIINGVISGKMAKEVFEDMFSSGSDPEKIIRDKGLIQITDEDEISGVVEEVLASDPQIIDRIRAGENKIVGYLIGQVMKKTLGKANPQKVNQIIKKKLEEKE